MSCFPPAARRILVVAACVPLFAESNLVAQNLYRVDFSGEVTFTDPVLSGTLPLGADMNGHYIFAADTLPNPGSNPFYAAFDALVELEFDIDGYQAFSLSDREIRTLNSGTGDIYSVASFGGAGLTGDPIGGLELAAFTLLLGDPTGTAINNALNLPGADLDIADYADTGFVVSFGGPINPLTATGGNTAGGTLDNLTVTVIPEPSTGLLFGMLALGLWRRRRPGC